MALGKLLLNLGLAAEQPVERGIQLLLADRLEREQRTERRGRRRAVELARRRQFRGRLDHPSDDHRQSQGDQTGGRAAGRKQTIKADLAGRPQHRGDMPMRQAAQHRQPRVGSRQHLIAQ